MLIMVVFLSAMMVAVTSVASLIVSFQARGALDSRVAAQSLFAADAGVENGLFCYFHGLRAVAGTDAASTCERNVTAGRLNYSVKMNFIKDDGSATRDPLEPGVKEVKVTGIGRTGRTVRILESRLDIGPGRAP